jgi:hypothetical protein
MHDIPDVHNVQDVHNVHNGVPPHALRASFDDSIPEMKRRFTGQFICEREAVSS